MSNRFISRDLITSKNGPINAFMKKKKLACGRTRGKITVRHRGGGQFLKSRIVDFYSTF